LSAESGIKGRLWRGLARTRDVLNTPVGDLVRSGRRLDAEAIESLEEALLAADVGVAVTRSLLDALEASDPRDARQALRRALLQALDRGAPPAAFASAPWVVLLVGVNGAGKTTTAGKLAQRWVAEGRRVLVCAADTFRAAAAEQLAVWAERSGADFHRGADGADPSAVLTDALRAARARGCAGVVVDTAGRLHTRGNLMAELAKMARVAAREIPGAPHETLLVLDGSVGSNALSQAREFAAAGGVSGLVLTKLDGTARGGAALAIVEELALPIRWVGVGETVEDLLPFDAAAFVDGLLPAEP
jgi:fused signal recognition particle receptor